MEILDGVRCAAARTGADSLTISSERNHTRMCASSPDFDAQSVRERGREIERDDAKFTHREGEREEPDVLM